MVLSIGQDQNKGDYTQAHIRDVYKEFGFQEIETKIKTLLEAERRETNTGNV